MSKKITSPCCLRVARFILSASCILCLSLIRVAGQTLSSSSGVHLDCDDPIIYLDDNSTLLASGKVRLQTSDFLLLANNLRWERNASLVKASGSVVFTSEETRILAESLELFLELGNYRATEVRSAFHSLIFEAREISFQDNNYTASDMKLFPDEPHISDPYFSVGFFSYDKNTSLAKLTENKLNWGGASFSALPDFTHRTRQAAFRTNIKAGKQSNLGWYLGTRLEREYSDELTTSIEFSAYNQRGIFISPTFSYEKFAKVGFSKTDLEIGWIRDQENDRGFDLRGIPVPKDRGHSRFKTILRQDEKWRLASQINWDSDSESYRDFRRSKFEGSQLNHSFGELTYEGNDFSLSVLANEQLNHHHGMVRNQPKFKLDAGPVPYFAIYHSMLVEYRNASALNNRGSVVGESNRLDLAYSLQKPISLANGVRYVPSYSFLHQEYELNEFAESRTLGEWGNDLIFTLHADLPIYSETWEISEIKHLMHFSIGHRRSSILGGSTTLARSPYFLNSNNLNLEPFGLLDHQYGENIQRHEVLRVGWEHALIGKWKNRSRNLITARFFHDIWKQESSLSSEHYPLFAEISLSPNGWIDFDLRSKINPNTGKEYRQSAQINLRDGRFHRFSASYYRYLDQGEFLSLELYKLLSERSLARVKSVCDLQEDRIPFWSIDLEFRPGNSWVWTLGLSERTVTRKENDLEFSLGARLFGF